MAKNRRHKNNNSPRNMGLLCILIVAAALGAVFGVWLGTNCNVPAGGNLSAGKVSRDLPPREQESSAATNPAKDLNNANISTEHPEDQKTKVTESKPLPETGDKSRHITRRRPSGLKGELVQAVKAGKKIALTFDAGASADPTPTVLDALNSAGLKTTFFLTGKWCEQNPGLVRRIRDEGHEIGNHTYSHPDLRKLSDDQIREQLEKTDDLVTRITGKGCDPFFRPPFGGRDNRVLNVVAEAGYTSVYWSIDSWDAFKKGITGEEIEKRVLDRVQGGDIVLMHCGSMPTANVLPSLIKELKSRGYEVVKVSELIM